MRGFRCEGGGWSRERQKGFFSRYFAEYAIEAYFRSFGLLLAPRLLVNRKSSLREVGVRAATKVFRSGEVEFDSTNSCPSPEGIQTPWGGGAQPSFKPQSPARDVKPLSPKMHKRPRMNLQPVSLYVRCERLISIMKKRTWLSLCFIVIGKLRPVSKRIKEILLIVFVSL